MIGQNKPTEKQQIALRHFGVKEEDIQKLDADHATKKLSELIEAANQKKIEQAVEARLSKAIQIIKRQIPDAENMSEYLTLVAEESHQLFADTTTRAIQRSKEAERQR